MCPGGDLDLFGDFPVTLRSVGAAGYNRSGWHAQRFLSAPLERICAVGVDLEGRMWRSRSMMWRDWVGYFGPPSVTGSDAYSSQSLRRSFVWRLRDAAARCRCPRPRSRPILGWFAARHRWISLSGEMMVRAAPQLWPSVALWSGRGLAAWRIWSRALRSTRRQVSASARSQSSSLPLVCCFWSKQDSFRQQIRSHSMSLGCRADRVTLAQLVHHSSGIPDYFGDLAPKGWEHATLDQQGALAKISAAKKLRFQPGTKWEYSNSNYLLLGVIIERVSGQSLGTFLRERIFDPLQLRMVAGFGQEIPRRARSYSQLGSEFENVNWHFYALGPSGIWSTPADLVRWADNYRSGSVGGPALLTRVVDGAQDTGIDLSPWTGARYGAGIFVLPDNRLVHGGSFEGFKSNFIVSPDRQSAVAVLCNRVESKPEILTEALAFIWEFR